MPGQFPFQLLKYNAQQLAEPLKSLSKDLLLILCLSADVFPISSSLCKRGGNCHAYPMALFTKVSQAADYPDRLDRYTNTAAWYHLKICAAAGDRGILPSEAPSPLYKVANHIFSPTPVCQYLYKTSYLYPKQASN